jgi:hypothetical protein
LIMDLEETEDRNDCAGEGQKQFNRPTESQVRYLLQVDFLLVPPKHRLIFIRLHDVMSRRQKSWN